LAKDALRDAAKGINPAAKKKENRKADTFKDVAGDFMERYSKKKKKSWRGDQRIIDNKLNPRIGRVKAKELTRAQVREIVETIAENAPYEANRVLACLPKIYNWAISEDLVEANPCDHVAAPGEEIRRDRVLTEDEIRTLWKDLKNEQLPVASTFKLRLLTAQRGVRSSLSNGRSLTSTVHGGRFRQKRRRTDWLTESRSVRRQSESSGNSAGSRMNPKQEKDPRGSSLLDVSTVTTNTWILSRRRSSVSVKELRSIISEPTTSGGQPRAL